MGIRESKIDYKIGDKKKSPLYAQKGDYNKEMWLKQLASSQSKSKEEFLPIGGRDRLIVAL